MRQAAVIISHFTDKENEAPREEVTGSRSPNQSVTREGVAMEDPKVLASETG